MPTYALHMHTHQILRKIFRRIFLSHTLAFSLLCAPSPSVLLSLSFFLSFSFRAGGPGHILNLGHGVIQETPEEAVGIFVDEAKKFKYSDITAADAAAAREVVVV